jgi:hypothetical protein
VSELWLLDPFSFPCRIIVYLVCGLGPVPFVHDESGSWSHLERFLAFRLEGIWWIDGPWPGICRITWESVSDVRLCLRPIQFSE